MWLRGEPAGLVWTNVTYPFSPELLQDSVSIFAALILYICKGLQAEKVSSGSPWQAPCRWHTLQPLHHGYRLGDNHHTVKEIHSESVKWNINQINYFGDLIHNFHLSDVYNSILSSCVDLISRLRCLIKAEEVFITKDKHRLALFYCSWKIKDFILLWLKHFTGLNVVTG